MRTMRRPTQIFSAVLFMFAAFFVREAIDLVYYTQFGPGPGFFPFWLGIIMMALSAYLAFQATFRPTEKMPDDFFASRAGYLRAGACVLAFLWGILMMDVIGFRLTMLVFFLFLLLVLGRLHGIRGAVTTVGVSLIGSWGSFWLFDTMLRVPLPRGMLGY
jgi:putative tricarboxylic transport membrane protein